MVAVVKRQLFAARKAKEIGPNMLRWTLNSAAAIRGRAGGKPGRAGEVPTTAAIAETPAKERRMARCIVGSTNGWWAWLAPCFANGACLADVDGTVDNARKIRVFFLETQGYPTNALRDVCRRASRSLLLDWPARLPHDAVQRIPLEEMNGLVYAGPWSSVVLAFGPPEC